MNTALSTSHNDAAFYRDRKAMLIFPVIIIPFLIPLFWILGGGKSQRYVPGQTIAGKTGDAGFNATIPTAKNAPINGRSVDKPAYGKALTGQVLSSFTHTLKDSVSGGLKAIPVSNQSPTVATGHASSLAATQTMANPASSAPVTATSYSRPANRSANAAALAATQSPVRQRNGKGFSYNAPGSRPYYTASASDQQLDQQLRSYEAVRQEPVMRTNSLTPGPAPASQAQPADETSPVSVRLSDNLTASRLNDAVDPGNAFNTAPTNGSRRSPERAVLSGGSSYGGKKTVAWMIPVVIHDDQAVKSGNSVKLRLLKEVSADGITIPANTILYAVCQLENERLRMTVRNVQLSGQLIPLDLEVYDLDGSPGVNMPGVSNQVSGQLQSSAIQGVQLPGVGGLVNSVANTARMTAANSARQTMLRLRGGYNLYLKAQ